MRRSSCENTTPPTKPSLKTLRGLDALNFFLSDVETGVGPFLAIYLAGYHWDEEKVGLALAVTLGAITTAVGIGAALSQVLAGGVVHHLGANAGFLFLAAIAAAAFAILFFFMPETLAARSVKEASKS